jgi:hypothetical protein
MVPAATKLRVERVEYFGVECADLDVAEERQDVLVDVSAVRATRIGLEVRFCEVTLEELCDRSDCPRLPPLVHLCEQTRPSLLGLALRPRASWDDLAQVVITSSHGVGTRVYAPLGSLSILPRGRFLPALALATEPDLRTFHVTNPCHDAAYLGGFS